ncbi:unnamed protein product [Acanthoscelides obtectus]|uniref:Uncharacterized protein n=1 Tax=Acanthoscelides obtectus TaxID=200917 RepID=A0A9P0JLL4_ACAOB|nr:unnamed protein product [Acanthoscelides obtectus]CAK1661382.1 hypothetical protein AOBTE_LOCUS22592 [Acanthoscelides obtectus]
MQHAHILAPPTRSAGWYLHVRQSETISAQRTATDQETEESTTAATAAA